MLSDVFGIKHLEVCVKYALFYNAQSYPPLIAFTPKSQLSTMHLLIHISYALFVAFI